MNVRMNVLANLGGRIWGALMSFAFVPVYVRLLGIEAYGLIGFFAALMGVFAILDLGLGITVNRELSRLSTQDGMRIRSNDLMRTFEIVYWSVAVIIGLVTIILAGRIVDGWLNIATIPRNEAIWAVRMMGLTAVMRWPVSLYVGALMGMQQQIRLNITTSIAATAAGAGAVSVLVWVAPTLPAFFAWQTIVAAVQICALRYIAWRPIRQLNYKPRATLQSLRSSWRFSAGITGITLLSIILTQLDKFLLSRLLPLADFGYYALAGAIAGTLTTAGAAVESAIFPALARHVARQDVAAERTLYHQASQGLALLIIPLSMTIVLFSPELLAAYTHNTAVVIRTHVILSLLTVGNGILALMFMPLSLQLANGWTQLSLWKNVFAVIIFVPTLYIASSRYGAVGAAATWISLTVAYLMVEVPIMHRRLLPGAGRQWYLVDIGIPTAISIIVLGTIRILMPPSMALIVEIVLIGGGWLAAVIVCAVILPTSRKNLLLGWQRLRSS